MQDISANARELARLDREIVRVLLGGDFGRVAVLLTSFRKMRLLLMKVLADAPAVSATDSETRDVLNRLSHGPAFTAENVLASITAEGEEKPILEPTDDEIDEIGSELLYSWISHYEYARNLFCLNAVIIGIVLPSSLLTYISEARTCFAFQQYNAVVALSRTILETAARDLCERLGLLETSTGNVVRIDSQIFNQLIRAVSSGDLYERAKKAYYGACPVIHGNRTVERESALSVLREVLRVVQTLYYHHGF